MSGNELRVTVMTGNTYADVHKRARADSRLRRGGQGALLQIGYTASCRWCTGGEGERAGGTGEESMACSVGAAFFQLNTHPFTTGGR